jgi:hypothetical protein
VPVPRGPGGAVPGGIALGLLSAVFAWGPALMLWPLALVLACLPRLRLVGVAGLACVLTMIGMAQLESSVRALPGRR